MRHSYLTLSTAGIEMAEEISPSSLDHDEDGEGLVHRRLLHRQYSTLDADDPENIDDDENEDASSTLLPRSLPIHQTNVPLVCCAILASITTGGTTYAFGLYGDALKKTLHLTQSQLDTISAVFFSAGLLSFIPGAYADRFGTRLGISIGGIAGATTLMLYWAVSKGFLPAVSDDPALVVVVLSILGVGIFLSCALVTGSVFKIISCQCGPGSKGSAVGVAKGFVGLGSGAYACLFESIRQPGTSNLDFLPMCAFFFITAATIPSWFVLPSKENEKIAVDVLTPLHFRVLYASLVALAVLIIGKSLNDLYDEAHRSGHSGFNDEDKESSPNYVMAGLILLVWIGPIVAQLFLPQRTAVDSAWVAEANTFEGQDDRAGARDTLLYTTNGGDPLSSPRLEVTSNTDRESLLRNEINGGKGLLEFQTVPHPSGHIPLPTMEPKDESLPADELTDEDGDAGERRISAHHNVGEPDKNLFQMLQSPSAWLMLWTCTILTGGGTVETNNLGQMVESLGFSSIVTPAALALFSVAQAGGRVITGAASEAALEYDTRRCCIDFGVPRPFFFVAASLAGVVAHTILALATEEVSFVIGVTLSGVAFGMIWPLMVLCVGEIFGTDHVGANYMFFDGFTSAAGTFVLSKMVAQRVYESHIDPNSPGNDKDGATCYGQECFQQTHVVIVVLSLTCLVTSAITQYRTRGIYDNSGRSRSH